MFMQCMKLEGGDGGEKGGGGRGRGGQVDGALQPQENIKRGARSEVKLRS